MTEEHKCGRFDVVAINGQTVFKSTDEAINAGYYLKCPDCGKVLGQPNRKYTIEIEGEE